MAKTKPVVNPFSAAPQSFPSVAVEKTDKPASPAIDAPVASEKLAKLTPKARQNRNSALRSIRPARQ
ncbi:hypothetical protein HGG75_15420 [Ochrobactrum pseudogrignonense]|nr:hypothetical protein [Brucella pseudogrignonensis]